MIQFKRLTPAMHQEIRPMLLHSGRKGCEYSFANLCMWGRQEAAVVDGFVTLFSHFGGRSMYPFPVGQGDVRPVLDKLIADSQERGIPFRLTSLTSQDRALLEQLYPGRFRFHCNRDGADYLYRIEDLAELKGRKFQQKRNHMNRFEVQHPDWFIKPLEGAVRVAAENFIDNWFYKRKAEDPAGDYQMEQIALRRAFTHFDDLGMEGIALYVDGCLSAVTMGSFISPEIFDVHFEKGDSDVPESYAAVNRAFARYLREKYPQLQYLNREDDMGLPGLRRAKLSYNPVELVEKCWAVLKAEDEDG